MVPLEKLLVSRDATRRQRQHKQTAEYSYHLSQRGEPPDHSLWQPNLESCCNTNPELGGPRDPGQSLAQAVSSHHKSTRALSWAIGVCFFTFSCSHAHFSRNNRSGVGGEHQMPQYGWEQVLSVDS